MIKYFFAAILLLVPFSANAVTYQYTGQNYNQLSYSNDGPPLSGYELRGPYDLSMNVTATVEFDSLLPANSYVDYRGGGIPRKRSSLFFSI